MRLVFTYQSSESRFSLVIALLAVIAFASFQTVELGHQHIADDVAENCVLGKTDSSAAVISGSTHTAHTGFDTVLNRMLDNSSSVEFSAYHLARAPPNHS